MSRPFRSSENFSTVLTDGRKTRLTPAGRSPPAVNRKGRTGRRCPGSSAPSSMICREAKPAAILGNISWTELIMTWPLTGLSRHSALQNGSCPEPLSWKTAMDFIPRSVCVSAMTKWATRKQLKPIMNWPEAISLNRPITFRTSNISAAENKQKAETHPDRKESCLGLYLYLRLCFPLSQSRKTAPFPRTGHPPPRARRCPPAHIL